MRLVCSWASRLRHWIKSGAQGLLRIKHNQGECLFLEHCQDQDVIRYYRADYVEKGLQLAVWVGVTLVHKYTPDCLVYRLTLLTCIAIGIKT